MAQGMVTDYFTRKKRTDPFQPSKRRKVQRTNVDDKLMISVASLPDLKLKSADSDTSVKQNSEGLSSQTTGVVPIENVGGVFEAIKAKSKTTQKTRTSTTSKRRTSTRSRTTRQKSVSHGPMDEVLARTVGIGKNKARVSPPAAEESSKPGTPSSDNSEEVTSISDDHDAVLSRSLPGTPTKRSQQNSEAPIRRKRCKPSQSEGPEAETGDCGGDAGSLTESKPELSSKTRQKKSVSNTRSSKSKASAKKSLDQTFQQYENKQTRVAVKKEQDGDTGSAQDNQQMPVSNSKRTEQSKRKTNNSKHGKAKEPSSRGDESQSKTDLTPGQQGTPSDGCKEGKQSDLGNRIRSTMKNQKSPVKEEPKSSNKAVKDKLTPTMVRERLCKSGKLAELQSRLAKIKECADQAKMQTKVATQKATNSEKEKPKSSSMPAYQKYHSLASPAPPSLTLPFKYKTLEKMFHSMDTVVSLLHNRKETCTFPKLKDAVQEMCRKTFELRNVGQIKTVYPTSYFLSQQKHRTKQNKSSNRHQPENEYQLTVQPNLESDGSTSTAHDSSEVGSQAMRGATSSLMKKFTPSMLIARRTIFHNSLVDIVKQHHRTFLSKLERPLSVPDDKLTRWHPKFPLDTIPEVEASSLPEPPAVKTYSSAKDVLDKAREMMTPRVAKALETVAKNSAMLKSAKPKPSSSATLTKLAQDIKGQGSSEGSGLKGVNQSLLERIRAKEAQKQVQAMMRNPEVEQRITRLERLPELCRILRVYFLSEKKSALLYDNIVKKLGDSCRSTLSRAEVEKHVDLMVEILPEWLTVHNIRKEKYIKMNKSQDINNVIDKVKKIWKESK